VKLVTAKNGRILGASIVGANAGDLIAMWTLAISQGLKVSAIAGMVLPYPTYGEAGKRAAITYYAGLAAKPFTRKLIGFLKKFG
jgi:pyruvate/2-oxoglutarate dehydrogenase complex dihydrolipoamide dehydrogenase (E3) component